MIAKLSVMQGARQGQSFPLAKEAFSIGRVSGDLSLADHQVSREHARISRSGAGYEIEDLGSRNGTFVNGVRIKRRALSENDEIRIGGVVMRFQLGEDGAPGNEGEQESTAQNPFLPRSAITLDAKAREILAAELNDDDILATRRAKSDLAAVYRSSQLIYSILETEKLYTELLNIIVRELPQVDFCSILLFREGTEDLYCKAYRWREQTDELERPAFSESIVRPLVQDRKAVLTFDAQHDDRFDGENSIAALHIRSAMCVPLQSRERLLGALQANTIIGTHRFDREDLKLLTAVGMLAGAALENAMLYEKLAAEKAALQTAHAQLAAAQEGLIRSEKLAAVGRLTAGIVHDVKNPMTVILNYAEMLQMALETERIETVGNFDVRQSLRSITEGVLHCDRVISQLLQFARPSAPTKTSVSLNNLVDDTLLFLGHEFSKARVRVRTTLIPDLPAVTADANQIRQVLLNILINAIQATTQDGRVDVSTNIVPSEGRDYAAIHIKDNGIGMPEDVRARLFEPFFTTKKAGQGPGGTGLGLSVSYGIIQSHGGTIKVESEPNKGSTFSVLLPLAAA